MKRTRSYLAPTALALAAAIGFSAPVTAAENGKFRVGIVTFLSGAAAGPFGVPSLNGAKLVIDALNEGKVPAPYGLKGINGLEIEAVIVDENGGASKQVEEFRNLAERHKVDAVIGYISSGDCLAIAPVAEELKLTTVFFDCGTSRLFEENKAPTYVFRTGLDAAIDNIGAARYLVDTGRKLESVASIQQNYAWGHDSWGDFSAAIKQLKPGVKITTEQLPKLFQGQYGAEISALSVSKPDVIHSSFWGGDMEAFVLQGNARGLFDKRTAVLTCGESALDRFKGQAPNGLVIGARGPFGAFAPENTLSTWFRTAYRSSAEMDPTYPAFKMAQAILGLKAAVEKAAGKPGVIPPKEEVARSFKGLSFESVSGTVRMARASGHQALQGIAYGEYKFDAKSDKAMIANVKSYSGECVTPPDGTTAADWIKAGFPGAQCN